MAHAHNVQTSDGRSMAALLPCRWPLAVMLAASLAGTAFAQTGAEVARDREASRQAILNDAPPGQVAADRRSCVAGSMPESIRKSRAIGWNALPDAADDCVAAALRMARDGQLVQPYRDVLADLGGASGGEQSLPASIGAAVMRAKSDRVSIGNGKAAIITPALAFDAGLTVAYQQRPRPPVALPEIAALKSNAERCLAQGERDLGLCYSTGYIYGLRAVNGLAVVAGN
jgi:hypothetical protein